MSSNSSEPDPIASALGAWRSHPPPPAPPTQDEIALSVIQRTPGLLRALRVKAGKTQVEIGRLLGVTGKTISTWEAGLCNPRRPAEVLAWLLWAHGPEGQAGGPVPEFPLPVEKA